MQRIQSWLPLDSYRHRFFVLARKFNKLIDFSIEMVHVKKLSPNWTWNIFLIPLGLHRVFPSKITQSNHVFRDQINKTITRNRTIDGNRVLNVRKIWATICWGFDGKEFADVITKVLSFTFKFFWIYSNFAETLHAQKTALSSQKLPVMEITFVRIYTKRETFDFQIIYLFF